LGVAYNKASKFSEGIEAYLKALELDPLNISAMFNLSLIYKKKKMYAECKKQLEKAIQIAAKTNSVKIHSRITKELEKIKKLIK
jgi:tetratricopeptide (TPR) repeat protein